MKGFEQGGSGLCVGSFILVGGQRLRKQVEADLGLLERRKERLNQACAKEMGAERRIQRKLKLLGGTSGGD